MSADDISQLVSDESELDELLSSGSSHEGSNSADTSSITDIETNQAHNHIEMRQIAGLGAGTVMQLTEGVFSFKEGDKESAFSVSVKDGVPTILPGNSDVWVDDQLVTQPTLLSNHILNVGSARFSIQTPRPEYGQYSKPIEPDSRTTITVPKFESISKSEWVPGSGDATQSPQNLNTESWEFIEEIRAARDEDARIQRLLHPDPEELAHRIDSGGFSLLNRDSDHPFFARFSIAYGSIPWIPKFNDNSAIPTNLHSNIDQLCILNSVPITCNLTNGPLAIVGPRTARLAVTRHSILSLVALNTPKKIELKIITTDKNYDSSWEWLSNLPSWVSSTENDYRVIIADSYRSLVLAGLEDTLSENNDIGLIIVADSLAEVPPYCSIVLQVSDQGSCRATSKNGDSLSGTAIGVTEQFSYQTAGKISEITNK